MSAQLQAESSLQATDPEVAGLIEAEVARQSVEIVPMASGRVAEINFTSGQRVKKGDLLVLARAEQLSGSRRGEALTRLASQLDGEAGAGDPKKVRMLADELRSLAAAR